MDFRKKGRCPVVSEGNPMNHSLKDELKQSAEGIKNKVRKASGAGRQKPPADRSPRAVQARRRKAGFIIGTVFAVLVLTILFFAIIFSIYINRTMKNKVEVDLSAYDLSLATEMYAKDGDSDDWKMYQTLYYEENRIILTGDQIPQALRDAAVAIEDKRFYKHSGVDWRGTVRAVFSTVTGGGVQGGSTITQQLIKNTTGNNETTVKRKVTEIYRALQLEKRYDKDEILTCYLNTVYFGESCYGAQTAARVYFGKDAKDLTLAECASLIAITNNPSMYDPLISDWTLENNRERQLLVLEEMYAQNMIKEKETYEAACNEKVTFTNGYTCFGELVEGYEAPQTDEADAQEAQPVTKARNSYFTDQVIQDIAKKFVEIYDLKDSKPDSEGNVISAYERAVSMVYTGGYKIYTTQNLEYQSIAEDVFENTKYQEDTDSYDQPLQAAMTIVDPYTGDVVAMVGGTGTKTADRVWNWATEVRPCGSAVKPISTYAPALDDGTITAASILDDYPIELNDSAWPKNSNGRYGGLTDVRDAVVRSLNTCAVRVNMMYGVEKSYEFMRDKLGFTTLTETDSQQVGNMALGGFSNGVTTEEMAAAYSVFVNDGIYSKPRTYVKVEDSEGKVIIDNEIVFHSAIKETTAYLMRGMLEGVVTGGTGTEAHFSGMSIGGKTGTTDDARDRYFVGFSPYYCAAVWCGYKSNEVVWSGGNPCAALWREVMSRIHEGKEDVGFHSCEGLKDVTVCKDSGLLATEACAADFRGSRVRTVKVAADTIPTQSCEMHKMISYCKSGKHVATASCPSSSVIQMAALDYNREVVFKIKAPDDIYLLSVLSQGECPVHGGAVPDPVDPDDIIDEPDDGPTQPEDPVDPVQPDEPAVPEERSDPAVPENPDGETVEEPTDLPEEPFDQQRTMFFND